LYTTEIDKESLVSANKNVHANQLQEKIEVREVFAHTHTHTHTHTSRPTKNSKISAEETNYDTKTTAAATLKDNNNNKNDDDSVDNTNNAPASRVKQPYPILEGVVKSTERYQCSFAHSIIIRNERFRTNQTHTNKHTHTHGNKTHTHTHTQKIRF